MTGQSYSEGVTAWIDFNRDGNFSDSEKIFTSPSNTVTPVSGTFSVPANAYTDKKVIMRVAMAYQNQPENGCNPFAYGEIEDYPVQIQVSLGTSEVNGANNNGIQIYPNPVSDILNVTKVSDKTVYKIYNAAGQLVGEGNINGGKINVSSLVKGGYVITIDEKGKDQFRSKFIKK
ncbi:Por secretion system C-terminal sorting domain-containing protein [Chryseobacterium oleae]|uniref:Por secretion system C-terminal sorting domain-containing protein n=1 Tax=Chryseobacterium oleae TaxID=491207 RepID=A0A1I5A8H9_CHROL|nr:GEVED domain-containing protein [Chryseobacterium oleae]SFN58439.1 Por secretion system C-terminal sorting domain-containing protein [Chryseobacterium oleae]